MERVCTLEAIVDQDVRARLNAKPDEEVSDALRTAIVDTRSRMNAAFARTGKIAARLRVSEPA